jgi:hypothetical protein
MKCFIPANVTNMKYERSKDLFYVKQIDECSRTSGICSNGVCENMMGTYQCVCHEGYQQIGSNRAHCEDVSKKDWLFLPSSFHSFKLCIV